MILTSLSLIDLRALYTCKQEAVEYSEEQVQDLLHIRHLFYTRLGQLARERTQLLRKLLKDEGQDVCACYHASDKLSQLTLGSEQLRENAALEYRVYLQFASAFYRGVRSGFM